MRRWWLMGAGVWSIGLLVVAVVAPAYRSSVTSSVSVAPGAAPAMVMVHSSSATLVQVNGFKVLIPLALPLLAVVAVALLLPAHRRSAGVVTASVVALCLVGMLTVGVFVLPVVIALVVACAQAEAAPR